MSSTIHITHDEEETIALGRRLASLLPPRAVVQLAGELGAGKTTLAKGIVEGLGAAGAEEVTSPTFTLIHEYGDPVRVYHVDLYRIEEPRQLAALGLEEIFAREAVVLIEWGEKFSRWLPPERIKIRLARHAEGREIHIENLEMESPAGSQEARRVSSPGEKA